MSAPHPTPGADASEEDHALGWFAALQRAHREHDVELGARAERALEQLGFVVRVVRPILFPPESPAEGAGDSRGELMRTLACPGGSR